jgi:hypothetical protein
MAKTTKQQMELFELGELQKKGGLKDQGETVDPQSQNQVPVGSLKKEVRDDVPINISEGEFVLPADVVRYHGLEKLMNLRQDAKSGLKLMDEMGQMGNSDEATLPDDMPFKPQKFQQGGLNINQPQVNQQNVVPGVTTQQPGQLPKRRSVYDITPPKVTTPTKPTYTTTGQPQYKPRTDTAATPPYSSLVGAPFGQLPRSETKRFVNEETGEELYIPFVNGQPIYPIPVGFKEAATIKKEAEEKDPTRATVDTTRVTDVSGDDNPQEPDTPEYRVASTLAKQERNPITDAIGNLFKAGPIGIALDKIKSEPKMGAGLDLAEAFETSKEAGELANKNSLARGAGYASYQDLATKLGVAEPKFEFGTEKGTIDRDTGKFFDQYGQAGDDTTGQVSYTSFDDFVNAMSASAKTGYYGSVAVAKSQPDNPKAQAFLKEMGETYKVDDPSVATGDERIEDTQEYKDDTREEEPVSDSTTIEDTQEYKDDTREDEPVYEDTDSSDGYYDDSDPSEGDDDTTSAPDTSSMDDSFGYTAQGGFMSKKRVKKIKKMKRGGLASRK